MKQLYILGRNPILSKAEILSYLQSNNIKYSEIFFKENFLIIKQDKEIHIQELGGTIKSGIIEFQGTEQEYIGYLEKTEIAPSEKFSYSVYGNVPDDIFREKFKEQRKKAMLRHGRKSIEMQDHTHKKIKNADFEFFLYNKEGEIFFSTINQTYSYKKIKARDLKKPVIRGSLAISPRLSKILINLSQAKENQLLLDPFCGVGHILEQALLKKINVYGIDKDKRAIENAKRNLKQLEKSEKLKANYKLLNKDSRNAPNISPDAIATEPSLGETVRKKPNEQKAKNIINNFEKLIIPILQKIQKLKKPNARIAITMPYIRNHSPNIEKICKQTKLKKLDIEDIKFPIKESRAKQFIGREIIILQ